jgi:MinD superfamily P-loop ATPase
MAVCPEKAVFEKERVLGYIEIGKIKDIGFIQGTLEIGQVMSPPIIKKIRGLAQPGAVNIIDAPPGTSCPVIAAMNGVDFVILVTEPTPFGLHDLTLAVQAVQALKIPHGIVINRADIGNDAVRKYAEKHEIPILMEIPFSRDIAEIYSRGELVVEKLPEYRSKFLDLFDRIRNLADKGAAVK